MCRIFPVNCNYFAVSVPQRTCKPRQPCQVWPALRSLPLAPTGPSSSHCAQSVALMSFKQNSWEKLSEPLSHHLKRAPVRFLTEGALKGHCVLLPNVRLAPGHAHPAGTCIIPHLSRQLTKRNFFPFEVKSLPASWKQKSNYPHLPPLGGLSSYPAPTSSSAATLSSTLSLSPPSVSILKIYILPYRLQLPCHLLFHLLCTKSVSPFCEMSFFALMLRKPSCIFKWQNIKFPPNCFLTLLLRFTLVHLLLCTWYHKETDIFHVCTECEPSSLCPSTSDYRV